MPPGGNPYCPVKQVQAKTLHRSDAAVLLEQLAGRCLECVFVCVCVCAGACVCERERESALGLSRDWQVGRGCVLG